MAKNLETEAILRVLDEVREIQRIARVGARPRLLPTQPLQKIEGSVERLLELLSGDWLISVVGYFVNHRLASPYARLDTEYKVQDLVHCLALSQIPYLHYEDPQKKNVGALTSTRVDFSSVRTQLFIEVKLATSNHTAKRVEAEISEDIVKYGRQRTFSTLIFFVYCHEYSLPSPREFERGFTESHTIGGHQFRTYCIVKP